jgi:hypothetical protein
MAVVVRDANGNALPFAQQDNTATNPPPSVGAQILSGTPLPGSSTPIVGSPTTGAATNIAAMNPPATPIAQPRTVNDGTMVATPSTARTPTTQPTQARGAGITPAVDDALTRARADEAVRSSGDELSPISKVLSYLDSKGQKRTNANVRLALEQNARDPTTIPGLVNAAPPTEEAPATTRSTGTSTGGGRNRNQPVSPTPPTNTGTTAATSAPSTGDGSNLGAYLALGGLPLTALGGYGAYRALSRNTGRGSPVDAAESAPPPERLATTPSTATTPATPSNVSKAIDTAVGEARPPTPTENPTAVAESPTSVERPPINVAPTAEEARGGVRPVPFKSTSPRVAPTADEAAALNVLRMILGTQRGGRPRFFIP